MSTGNSVAEYKEIKVECRYCQGTGRRILDNIEFREYLEYDYSGKRTFRDMMKEYRDWKDKNNTIICTYCDGCGEWWEMI